MTDRDTQAGARSHLAQALRWVADAHRRGYDGPMPARHYDVLAKHKAGRICRQGKDEGHMLITPYGHDVAARLGIEGLPT